MFILFTYLILISIHAPREGSDPMVSSYCSCWGYFNPRSP